MKIEIIPHPSKRGAPRTILVDGEPWGTVTPEPRGRLGGRYVIRNVKGIEGDAIRFRVFSDHSHETRRVYGVRPPPLDTRIHDTITAAIEAGALQSPAEIEAALEKVREKHRSLEREAARRFDAELVRITRGLLDEIGALHIANGTMLFERARNVLAVIAGEGDLDADKLALCCQHIGRGRP